MKKITVISGKGGTGKTTLVSNLAYLAGKSVLADCDVDAPNLHILLNPQNKEDWVFKSSQVAVRDDKRCISCGKCFDLCRFGAIEKDSYFINPIRCDGCNVCAYFCPVEAIKLEEEETGRLFLSETEYGEMIHARLKAGADNSGKLVSEVRKEAEKVAEMNRRDFIIIDGSPGIGCPVIASLNGTDLALIVTEPTKSGLSDLKRVFEVVKYFSITAMVVINKYDLNKVITKEIELFCRQREIIITGLLPFDHIINEALHRGKILLNYKGSSRPAMAIRDIWQRILMNLNN